MPSLRRAVSDASVTGVPVELSDASHPVWASVSSTRKWLTAQGLTIGQQMDWGPINRCNASGRAWALHAGIVRTVSYGSGQDLDLKRMRELGIRAGSGGGEVRERWELRKGGSEAQERFQAAGIRVEGDE